jgi:hypothetical protein
LAAQPANRRAWQKGINTTAREVGVGTGTVQRIKQEMKGPFTDAAA